MDNGKDWQNDLGVIAAFVGSWCLTTTVFLAFCTLYSICAHFVHILSSINLYSRALSWKASNSSEAMPYRCIIEISKQLSEDQAQCPLAQLAVQSVLTSSLYPLIQSVHEKERFVLLFWFVLSLTLAKLTGLRCHQQQGKVVQHGSSSNTSSKTVMTLRCIVESIWDWSSVYPRENGLPLIVGLENISQTRPQTGFPYQTPHHRGTPGHLALIWFVMEPACREWWHDIMDMIQRCSHAPRAMVI